MTNKSIRPTTITHYLGGIDFPANKSLLIEHAKERDAEKEIISLLQRMPEREYKNMAEVMKDVGQLE